MASSFMVYERFATMIRPLYIESDFQSQVKNKIIFYFKGNLDTQGAEPVIFRVSFPNGFCAIKGPEFFDGKITAKNKEKQRRFGRGPVFRRAKQQ